MHDPRVDFFDSVARRRSVRKYLPEVEVPDAVVEKALDAALLAPNSSNLQTWQFYRVTSAPKRASLIAACLNQNAARSSKHLVVVAADPALWRKHAAAIVAHARAAGAPKLFFTYYEKLTPWLQGAPWAALLKWLTFSAIGLFRPIARRPWSRRDVAEIAIKSAALGAQNFMLAVAAQGFDTCPMEGFDEARVKRILGLGCRARVVMVISVGARAPNGIWGERFRVPRDWVVKHV